MKVSAYIFTKSIAAGTVLSLALGRALGMLAAGERLDPVAIGAALFFLAVTGVLLIADLKQPWRFWKILVRPQWRSWLALGSFVITAYGALLALLWVLPDSPLRAVVLGVSALGAVLAAAYTGFLFGQAEGRDYWQNPLLPVHLVVHAFLAGSAALLLLAVWGGLTTAGGLEYLRWVLASSLVVDLAVLLLSELGMRQGTKDAVAASRWLTHGPGRRPYWVGVLLVGHVVPLALLGAGAGAGLTAGAAAASCIGLFLFSHLWILAGQSQPLS